jgi:altronate hydrolase
MVACAVQEDNQNGVCLRDTAGSIRSDAPGTQPGGTLAFVAHSLRAAGFDASEDGTGRGTPLGFPVPTVKVASNQGLAEGKPHWIDFDASLALRDGLAAADLAFAEQLAVIASGAPTAAERAGQRAIAIWKRGVTL